MTNVIVFRRPVETERVTALPNPSFEPAEVVEMTPRERKRLARQQAEPETETARNGRLRRERWRAWRAACTRVSYYEAALDMHAAIGSVCRLRLAEADNHPSWNSGTRFDPLARYRAAVAALFLTPASCSRDIEWKRRKMRSPQFPHFEITPDMAERCIAEDLEFLASHPVRKPKCA